MKVLICFQLGYDLFIYGATCKTDDEYKLITGLADKYVNADDCTDAEIAFLENIDTHNFEVLSPEEVLNIGEYSQFVVCGWRE